MASEPVLSREVWRKSQSRARDAGSVERMRYRKAHVARGCVCYGNHGCCRRWRLAIGKKKRGFRGQWLGAAANINGMAEECWTPRYPSVPLGGALRRLIGGKTWRGESRRWCYSCWTDDAANFGDDGKRMPAASSGKRSAKSPCRIAKCLTGRSAVLHELVAPPR